MSRNSNALAEQVSAVSPIRTVIDGTVRKQWDRPQRPVRRPAPPPSKVRGGWRCPACAERYPETAVTVHLIEHVTELQDLLDRAGPDGVQAETDEMGNLVLRGPGGNPAMWIRLRDLTIDPGVQRSRDPSHPLYKPGVTFDDDKAEAITVTRIYATSPDDESAQVQIGHRVVEGQQRVLFGQEQCPDRWVLCVIVSPESRQDESRLARQITASRTRFPHVENWHSLLREAHPNVTAAAGLLDARGYLVVKGGYGYRHISAVTSLMKIAGLNPRALDDPPAKTPADATRDLGDVLNVIEGIAEKDGEANRRYAATLLNHVADIITRNRDMIDTARFARAMGTRTAEQWLALTALGRDAGQPHYLRDQMITAYNKGGGKNKVR